MEVRADKRRATLEEYFRLELDALEKNEYRDGEIVAMAGGTIEHSIILMNVGGEIRARLKGKPCVALESNARVRTDRSGSYSYPDASVICGPIERDRNDPSGQTAINPTLIVEVLSPSTELHDRTTKFYDYVQIESFREYVLVSQKEARVETFFRDDDGSWRLDWAIGLDSVAKLRSIGIELPLAEVYANVTFPPAAPPPSTT